MAAMASAASLYTQKPEAWLAIAWCSPPKKLTARSTSPCAIARAAATEPPAISAAASCIPGKIGSSWVPSPCPTENGNPVAEARRTAQVEQQITALRDDLAAEQAELDQLIEQAAAAGQGRDADRAVMATHRW